MDVQSTFFELRQLAAAGKMFMKSFKLVRVVLRKVILKIPPQ